MDKQPYAWNQDSLRSLRRNSLCLGLISLTLGLFCPDAQAQTCTQALNGPANTMGCWSDVLSNADGWPLVAIHSSLLPDGRIISWGRIEEAASDNATIWDRNIPWNFGVSNGAAFKNVYFPAATYDTSGSTNPPNINTVNSNYDVNLFCAGHTFLPDGRLLVAGGHSDDGGDGRGLNATHSFDHLTDQWTTVGRDDPPGFGTARSFGDLMNDGRWYPNLLTLPQAADNAPRALVAAGNRTAGGDNTAAQIWEEGVGWATIDTRNLPLYPFMHLIFNGKVFNSGPNTSTKYLNLTTGWEAATLYRTDGGRDYGSSVMYDAEAGRIVTMGGGAPLDSAEVINLSDASPAWRAVESMGFRRRQLNATLLPDGTVLVTGGTSAGEHNDATGSVKEAESWDPVSETWTTMNPEEETRIYHSVALLMPDATVFASGSGRPDGGDADHFSAQIFYPPYLFQGVRPAIQTVSSADVLYGDTVTVTTDVAVDTVTLLPLGSVTHAFNFNQRIVRPGFTGGGTTNLTVTLPPNPNVAPPGVYMLFVLSGGVPSHAEMIRISAGDYDSNPVVNIDTVIDLSVFSPGDPIMFTARANDAEEGDLRSSVSWDSNIDGVLGTGSPLTTSTLSPGTHIITASVNDLADNFGSDWIEITVLGACLPGGGGQPCTSSTNCCAGTGACTGGRPSRRVCLSNSICGDEVQESPEDCDGTDLDGSTCQSLGFDSGTLECTASCTFDTTGCTGGAVCGANKDSCNQDSDCCSANCKNGSCRGN